MKTLRYALFLLSLLWSPWLRAQISTDTCCLPAKRPAIPERTPTHGIGRLTTSLGVAAQYRLDTSDNQAFLNIGGMGTLAADYYFRRRFGLGIEAGYLSYGVRQAYTQFFDQARMLDNLITGPTEQLATNNLYSYHLLAGPALSLTVFRHLTLTTALRGGVFYNDAPTGSVYELGSQRLLYHFSTNDKRLQLGGQFSLGLYFPLSPDLQLGVGGAAFASPVVYTVDNLQGKAYTFDRVLSGYSAFTSLVFVVRTKQIQQLPVVLPGCYAPVLTSTKPLEYNVAQGGGLVFKWKSGAPIYAADEEFTFCLYSMPGNVLELQKTTSGTQLSWPVTQKLPEGPQCYYTLQASRRDQAGQRCLSPVTTGIVRLVRK